MSSSLNVGDFHNFGKRVEYRIDPKGHPAFFKPRTLYWEYQFLCANSELRRSLVQYLGHDCLAPLGNIGFFSDDGFQSGYMEPVEECLEQDKRSFESFAEVAAIATAFGMVDLHFTNCLITHSSRFGILDIECPFFLCESVAETALVGRRNLPFERSGIARLSPLLATNPDAPEIAKLVITHYKALDQLGQFASQIRQVLQNLPVNQVTIRILMRSTRDYRNHEPGSEPFFDEERIQLERGDIPYFFKFPGNDTAFFYNTPSSFKAIKEVPSIFKNVVERSGASFLALFATERLLRIKAQSALLLAHRALSMAKLNTAICDEIDIRLDSERLVLDLGSQKIEAHIKG